MTVRRHRRYSTECKIQLVQAYLDGEGSARSIATRHEVPHSLLMVWIKKYEAGDLPCTLHHRASCDELRPEFLHPNSILGERKGVLQPTREELPADVLRLHEDVVIRPFLYS